MQNHSRFEFRNGFESGDDIGQHWIASQHSLDSLSVGVFDRVHSSCTHSCQEGRKLGIASGRRRPRDLDRLNALVGQFSGESFEPDIDDLERSLEQGVNRVGAHALAPA